jgi:hypothetical protein
MVGQPPTNTKIPMTQGMIEYISGTVLDSRVAINRIANPAAIIPTPAQRAELTTLPNGSRRIQIKAAVNSGTK